jgi:branched-chain amino acid transport system ATP-binding protein
MNGAIETVRLCKNFGGLVVADAIDFRMDQGARHALIGPNGAGKTTFVNLVSGALRPSSGGIRLAGEDVTALSQSQRVKRGLVRTFQINALFRRLSVLENVTLAIAEREGVAGDFIRPAGRHRAAIDEAFALLEDLGLAAEVMRPVTDLAYGRQRLTEIAIALALKPKVLLLDEPAAGIPTGDVGTIVEVIERLPASIAVLLIEHDMDLVFRFARHITVLVGGRILVEGAPDVIARNPLVRQVYLGERGRR